MGLISVDSLLTRATQFIQLRKDKDALLRLLSLEVRINTVLLEPFFRDTADKPTDEMVVAVANELETDVIEQVFVLGEAPTATFSQLKDLHFGDEGSDDPVTGGLMSLYVRMNVLKKFARLRKEHISPKVLLWVRLRNVYTDLKRVGEALGKGDEKRSG